jgi:ketosteroid isomerase-like protein
MKIRLVLAFVGLAITFALPTFAQQKGTVDPKVDQQIRALTSNFDAAFNRNDAAAVAALYTQDGVTVLPWGGGFHGRQAIERGFAGVFKSWHPSNQISKLDR